jgi:hypothetical protein
MARNKTKVCPQCKETKPRTRKLFAVSKKGVMSWCRKCISNRATAWGKTHPERASLNRRRWKLKILYGMTPEEYSVRLRQQKGRCKVCGRKPEVPTGRFSILHVDHDHETGEVRGLLCWSCNAGLGNMKDDPKILRAAADYLDNNKRRLRCA